MFKKSSLNLKDYILQLDYWIPKHILDKTLIELPNHKDWYRHTYTNDKTFKEESKNGDRELNVSNGDQLTYLQEIHDYVWKALEKYILLDKISGETFVGWTGFSKIKFNRYNQNQLMSKHSDHIVSLFSGNPRGIPILSIIGVLNDDYKGGEFIMFDDYEIKFKAGDVLIFPSIFLYPHLVNPVTKGTRYSFVSWCY
jgi:predicted 2-oxoglutarate/Fe(II)-dependent dioxygenase YbiX